MSLCLLTFVLLLLCPHLSPAAAQCLTCAQSSCRCPRLNLREIPPAASKLVTELDVSFNRLVVVRAGDFVSYSGLRSLILSNNNIRTIKEEAFFPLARLEKLDLSFNSLSSLSPSWFQKLSTLRYLNLEGNKYTKLGEGNLFQPLTQLKTLHVGGSQLQSVTKRDFSGLGGLEELFFDGQNLRVYEQGSLRQTEGWPLKHVALGLNGPFQRDTALVEDLLSDVAYPNTTLTFTNTHYSTYRQMSPLRKVNEGGTRRVIFKTINMTFEAGLELLVVLSHSQVSMMALEDINLIMSMIYDDMPNMDRLEEIFVKNINIANFYEFPAVMFLGQVITGVQKMTVQSCKVYAMPCDRSNSLQQLKYVDITDNFITDVGLDDMMCHGDVLMSNLETINISRNLLQSPRSHLFTKQLRLENLDMSGNNFHSLPDTCFWPPRLRFLNFSSMHLKAVTSCLPPSLQVLDLSHNELTVFSVHLPLLRALYVSGNKINQLPDGSLYPRLSFLFIQNNDIHTLSSENLTHYENLTGLQAGANTYDCSCEFVSFMKSEWIESKVRIRDGLQSYVCDTPDTARGQSVSEASLSVFECHMALALSLLLCTILLVILLVVGLCHKFSVPWYLRMTWTWLRAKRKPKLKKGELEFDAFVSYSEMDTGWVDAHLVPELEQAEHPLRLCLHKRDFLPGGWILDNIMDAIEKSRRTLFVLSRHFVQSEWCKYELDYTHFRLFDHNDDSVVLILLENIDKETIPKKFCRLRRVMNSRTYLEWPNDENLIPRFWQSLRAAIRDPGPEDGAG